MDLTKLKALRGRCSKVLKKWIENEDFVMAIVACIMAIFLLHLRFTPIHW